MKNFYLARGTSASIQLGHRISIDLDFFTEKEFDPTTLQTELLENGIEISDVKTSQGTLILNIAGAKVSFFHYPYPLISEKIRFEKIYLANLTDIALMKLTAIASRGSKKDFVDLFYIFRKIKPQVIIDKFELKFSKEQIDKYHYLKSLTYFDDADKEPDPNMLIDWNWIKIKTFFNILARKIYF